jgi:hypothetical protein
VNKRAGKRENRHKKRRKKGEKGLAILLLRPPDQASADRANGQAPFPCETWKEKNVKD